MPPQDSSHRQLIQSNELVQGTAILVQKLIGHDCLPTCQIQLPRSSFRLTVIFWLQKDTFAEELAALPVDDVSAVAKLSTSARFKETLQEVDAQVALHGDAMPASWAGPSDADPTYRLIVACNELAMVVDDEIAKVHAYIQEKCAPWVRFLCDSRGTSGAASQIPVGHWTCI